jgi:hypothetical protein
MRQPIQILTVYADTSDLWSVEDDLWNTKGPQCWENAPDLCTWFTMMGNRYQAQSSYVMFSFMLRRD